MSVFNKSINVVKQAGRRRGASIAILNDDHPEIEAFIESKTTEGKFKNFNISILVSDAFMHAVHDNKDWDLKFKGTVYKTVKARDLFDKMVRATYKYGEPGYIFRDTINRNNPNIHLGEIISTNPCGEIPIFTNEKTGGGESCNLGSIDVSKFVKGNTLDWDRLEPVIEYATIFLNEVLHKNAYPFPEIEEMTLATAKLGLNPMGLADAMILTNRAYDSPEGIAFGEEIQKFINDISIRKSIELVSRYGVYPAWEGSTWQKKGIRIANSVTTCSAPTGTVSIIGECSAGIEPKFSFVHQRRNCIGKEYFVVNDLFADAVTEVIEEKFPKSEWDARFEEVKDYCYTHGSIQGVEWLPDSFKRIFKTNIDISPEYHVDMQAALQRHTGNSISKTCILPYESGIGDMIDTIQRAWKSGCKGITLYRQGSRDEEVITLKREEKTAGITDSDSLNKGQFVGTYGDTPSNTDHEDVCTCEECDEYDEEFDAVVDALSTVPTPMHTNRVNGHRKFRDTTTGEMRYLAKRPDELPGMTVKRKSGCNKMMITVNDNDGAPYELLISSKKGGCKALQDAVALLISLSLRWHVPPLDICRAIEDIECKVAMNPKTRAQGISCPNIIANYLKSCLPDEPDEEDLAVERDARKKSKGGKKKSQGNNAPVQKEPPRQPTRPRCPGCGEFLDFGEGCNKGTCASCGWSGCN
jgi:adenosylcobalamin-dependent ribonucleoside-diphosphate reductase